VGGADCGEHAPTGHAAHDSRIREAAEPRSRGAATVGYHDRWSVPGSIADWIARQRKEVNTDEAMGLGSALRAPTSPDRPGRVRGRRCGDSNGQSGNAAAAGTAVRVSTVSAIRWTSPAADTKPPHPAITRCSREPESLPPRHDADGLPETCRADRRGSPHRRPLLRLAAVRSSAGFKGCGPSATSSRRRVRESGSGPIEASTRSPPLGRTRPPAGSQCPAPTSAV
jgi:hypothetical protein